MHKIENDIGQSTDVLKLIFYTFSFFSSTMLKVQDRGCWPTADIVSNRKTKCIFFLLIFFIYSLLKK